MKLFVTKFVAARPILARFLMWVVIPSLLVMGVAYQFIVKGYSFQDTILEIEGIDKEISIAFDEYGIPTIKAHSDADAYFAMGYIHAHDRMWQMEEQRLLAQGRLSSINGWDSVDIDTFMRTIGVYHSAKSSVERLGIKEKAVLDAYVSGINAWLGSDKMLPIEYWLLGYQPKKWELADSLAIITLMSLNLSHNYYEELIANAFVRKIGVKKTNELMPGYFDANGQALNLNLTTVEPISEGSKQFYSKLERNYSIGLNGAGSNAWVVSGIHTKSGKPLLASDPHLGVTIPSTWYLANISGGEIDVRGATLPGLPMVLMGENKHIAWGAVTSMVDVQDLYALRMHPHDDHMYELDGDWKSVEVSSEFIEVKADFPSFLREPVPPIKIERRVTHHGPIISDALPASNSIFALSWTALNEEHNTFSSLVKVNYATNWDMFRQALVNYVAPPMNYIYADVDNNIGMMLAGKIPSRKAESGRLPSKGWLSNSDWSGAISPNDLPVFFNPSSGILSNANNMLEHSTAQPLSGSWQPKYRINRINSLLEGIIASGQKLTPDEMIAIQKDQVSIQSQELLPFIRKLKGSTEHEKKALYYLSRWDGNHSVDSIEATIYQYWYSNFKKALVYNELDNSAVGITLKKELETYIERINPLFVKRVLANEYQGWCDLKHSDKKETCKDLAQISLRETMEELEDSLGDDIDDWNWGRVHSADNKHSVLSNSKVLEKFTSRTISNGGGPHTVNVAPYYDSKSDGLIQIISASYRQVIDLSDKNKSLFMQGTGQSGNIFSDHYDDLIEYSQDVELLELWPGETSSGQPDTIVLMKPVI